MSNLTSALSTLPPKILFFGPPGTGKTAFATSAGDVTQVLDLDGGLRTCMHMKDTFTANRQAIDVLSCMDYHPDEPIAFTKAMSYVNTIFTEVNKKTYKHKLLVIDSLTALAEAAVRLSLKEASRLGQNPRIQDWGMAFSKIENFLLRLRHIALPVVMLAHQQENEVDEKIMYGILVPGRKLPDKIVSYFDEVYYSTVKPSPGGKSQYVIQVVRSPTVATRSRYSLAEDFDQSKGIRALFKLFSYEL